MPERSYPLPTRRCSLSVIELGFDGNEASRRASLWFIVLSRICPIRYKRATALASKEFHTKAMFAYL